MKVRVILFSLAFLVVLFCLTRHSQAYVGPPYFDGVSYPSEHPWQHNDLPESEEGLSFPKAHIVVLPFGFDIKAILLMPKAVHTEQVSDSPGSLKSDHINQVDFRDKR